MSAVRYIQPNRRTVNCVCLSAYSDILPKSVGFISESGRIRGTPQKTSSDSERTLRPPPDSIDFGISLSGELVLPRFVANINGVVLVKLFSATSSGL